MTALILIDIQNDFFPGGALAVPHAEEIIPTIKRLLEFSFDAVVSTQDWHPPHHGSFAQSHHKPVGTVISLHGVQQILWPIHCVQNTHGSDLVPGWDHTKIQHKVLKGTEISVDSYSGFYDNELNCSTGLELLLKQLKITTVVIAGVATEYCVKYTVLDAIRLGFKTIVIPEGCRGVNLNKDDADKALKEMIAHGAVMATVNTVTEIAGITQKQKRA